MPDVTLSIQNTLSIGTTEVTRLIHPGVHGATRRLNVINLGPGTIWLKSEGNPAVGDVTSEMLSVNIADNDVPYQDFIGLIADQTSTVVVRIQI